MAYKRTRTSMLLLSLSLAAQGALFDPALAKEGTPLYRPDPEHYLGQAGGGKRQGLLKEESKKFRSYPRLDRAYRLQRQGRAAEAAKEFEAYLALAPEDLRAQLDYLMLLDRNSRHAEVAARADQIASRWPAFLPAYFYKGFASQKLGRRQEAYDAFAKAAALKGIRKEDRIFALATATDLALSLQRYADAAKAVQALLEIEQSQAWYLKAGRLYEKSGELNRSLEAYGSALELAGSPQEKVAAALALAETAKKLNLTERTRQAYRSALEGDPGNAAALRGLADLAYLGKRYDEAEKWMLLLKKTGFKAQDREFLAQLYLKRGAHAAAIAELKAVLQEKGKNASDETLSALAQAYESAGRRAEALPLYRSLLARAPESGERRLRLGALLVQLEQYQAAEPLLLKALGAELSPAQKSSAHRNLSLIYEKQGSYDKAGQHLKLSQQQPAAGAESLVRLAVLASRSGQEEEALGYLDRALAQPALADRLRRQALREKSAILEKRGEAAAAAAELAKTLPAGAGGDPETALRLAVLLGKSGNNKEALRYLDLALADRSLKPELRRSALREKGLALEKQGEPLAAAQEYEKALAAGERSAGIYLILANLYHQAGQAEPARSYWHKVLEASDAGSADKCAARDGLGLTHLQQGELPQAAAHFTSALERCGESWQRRYYAGLAQFRAKNWQEALEQFQLAQAQRSDAATLLAIALCHQELQRPGAAVHYLQQALELPGPVEADQLQQIQETLGYLYAEEHAYDKAADAFAVALAQAPDQVLRLRLASVLHLSGASERAWQTLEEVEPDRLPAAEQVAYRELKAGVLQKLGRLEQALALLEQNYRQEPTAARSHSLGVLYQASGQGQAALDRFQAAYRAEPQQDQYALSLGYAYLAEQRFREALAPFQVVAERNPEAVQVREQLGYLHARLGQNEQAAQWFRQALDASPVAPLGGEEAQRWQKDTHRMRSEIGKLSRDWGLSLYGSYRAGDAPSTLVTAGDALGTGLNGESGLEGWYRPPVLGFRDERILELFARVYGNLDANSLSYQSDSTQAGVGARYKLLRDENLWISGERLFGIGDEAQSDWLLRVLYSRGAGYEPLPWQPSQDYYLLYAELDGYLQDENLAAYGELRKGRSFTLASQYLVSPHLVLDGRWQSSYRLGGEYLEGGAGASLKYFYNSSRYFNYRHYLDFSVTYKHGTLFSSGGEYDSVLIRLGLFF